MFKRRLIAADQASVFMAMMSDYNSLDLAPQRQEMSVENVSLGLVLKDKRRQTMTTLTPCPQDKMLFLQQKSHLLKMSLQASFLKDKRRQTRTTLTPCPQDKMLFLQQKSHLLKMSLQA
ncbi:hypothetical protein Tco_0177088, partial [Tanacetum coccineum]